MSEVELRTRFLQIIEASVRELKYEPAIFARMLGENPDSIAVAKQLIRSEKIQSGLYRVRMRPDLSMEHVMLESQFAALFTEDDLEIARFRLRLLGSN